MTGACLHKVRLPGGITLQYAERGERGGPALLLLHGFTDSLRSWERVMEALPADVHAFALSQRGHGDSDRPASGYRTRDFAADTAAFIRAMNVGPMWVVGHSMGAHNARRLAADSPGLVRGLVLVNAFARFRGNPVIEAFYREGIAPLVDPVDPQFAREFQESTVATPVDPAFMDRMIAESLKLPAAVWRAACEGQLEDDTGSIEPSSIPVQLHWGDQDSLSPRAGQDELVQRLGASLCVYEGTGHALHWEQPERFAARLMAFIRDNLKGQP